jgi:8-oxo-dGTP diphosphatase
VHDTVEVCHAAPVTSERRYVGTPEAARRVGMDQATLRRKLGRGEVRSVPHGTNRLRWDVTDLRRQLGLPPEDTMTSTLPRTTDPVVITVITSRLGVLVTRRHDNSPPVGFLSGEVEDGELAEDAAVREAKEETGLAIVTGHRIGELAEHPRTGRHVIYQAAVPVDDLTVRVDDEEELQWVEWIPTLSALLDLIPRDSLFPPLYQHLSVVLPE